jgi:hypothetical protein
MGAGDNRIDLKEIEYDVFGWVQLVLGRVQ